MCDLSDVFQKINLQHFDGFLDPPILRWNSRLRASAGRFVPRRFSPAIEVASYLLTEKNAADLIFDTVAHEMIHYWLWVRRKPYGHTDEFWIKMEKMGVSRYNPVPRLRPYRYVYRCTACLKEFFVKRRLATTLACAQCCKAHSAGKYDRQFILFLDRALDRSEGLELVKQRSGAVSGS